MRSVLLADADAFYVSCHLVFDPRLRGKAVIVLSNNDGCVVARSAQARALGIKMGQPLFEIRGLVEREGVVRLSSTYELYQDMSDRIFDILVRFSCRCERYSIDEAYLDASHIEPSVLCEYGHLIRATVLREVGVPLSIGIATTKTLAKIATSFAKKHPECDGVCTIVGAKEQEIDELLEQTAIKDVWGIGPQYTAKLMQSTHRVRTARDFKYADMYWVRRHLTVVGARTQLELRGIVCLPIIIEEKPKKGLMNAKTFGKPIQGLEDLESALATYTARAAAKLREQCSLASGITVFVTTNRFSTSTPQYANEASLTLAFPTAFTPDLIQSALLVLRRLYRPGFAYRKAGVFLHRISPGHVLQTDLFGEFSLEQHDKKMRVMAAVDFINTKWGRDTIYFGAQGSPQSRTWQMKQTRRSPCYTTQWKDIIRVHAE